MNLLIKAVECLPIKPSMMSLSAISTQVGNRGVNRMWGRAIEVLGRIPTH